MKRLTITLMFFISAICAISQNLTSTYFLDHDNTRFRINPAFMPENDIKGLFGIAISNISVTPQSNIGLSSLLFPVNGKLVTGLNEQIPAAQFLGGLNDQNTLNIGANLNLLTVGFRTDPAGFATIELNVRSNTFNDIPKSLFSFLKLGSSQNSFDIRNYNVSTTNFAELALGYSRKIGDMFQVGGRIKLLGGIGRADMLVDRVMLNIDSPTKMMEIASEGTIAIHYPGLEIGTRVNPDGTVVYDLSSITGGKFKPAGFGVAFDLGISCTPLEGLELNAAIQDAGFISWKNTVYGEMAANTEVSITSAELEKALNSILNFEPEATSGSTGMSMPVTLRIGARYAMPFYDRLSFGVLETLETGGGYFTFNDIRVGATVTPIDQISVAVNYGYTSLGSTLGLACNFNLGPVQLFLGTDAMMFSFTPQGVPISKLNTTVSGGLLFQFRSKGI